MSNSLLSMFTLLSSMAIRRQFKKFVPKYFSKSRDTRNSDTESLRVANATVSQSNDTGPGNHIDHVFFMV